jgi:hypothetical protein
MVLGRRRCEPPRVITRALLAGLALGASTLALPLSVSASEAQATTTRPVTILKGTFTDTAKYTGSGTATVTRRGTARTLQLARDFRADPGAIRLRLYLATSASGATHIDLGPMAESGAQRFSVPARTSLSRYRYVIAWCAAVNEPITQARLGAVGR